jgi:hypothetical protein
VARLLPRPRAATRLFAAAADLVPPEEMGLVRLLFSTLRRDRGKAEG